MRQAYGVTLKNGYLLPPRGFCWWSGFGVRAFAVGWTTKDWRLIRRG